MGGGGGREGQVFVVVFVFCLYVCLVGWFVSLPFLFCFCFCLFLYFVCLVDCFLLPFLFLFFCFCLLLSHYGKAVDTGARRTHGKHYGVESLISLPWRRAGEENSHVER